MTAGLRFDEQMTGSWSPEEAPDVGNTGQYVEAAEAGAAAGRAGWTSSSRWRPRTSSD